MIELRKIGMRIRSSVPIPAMITMVTSIPTTMAQVGIASTVEIVMPVGIVERSIPLLFKLDLGLEGDQQRLESGELGLEMVEEAVLKR